jgi:hypothetical protein
MEWGKMVRSTALAAAVLLSFFVSWAGRAQAASEAEKVALTKAYEKYAVGFRAGNADRAWEAIDPQCVFIDESGGRESAGAMLSKSKEFFSTIRNTSISYTITDVQSKNGQLIVHVDTEARFDLKTGLFFFEKWSPKILNASGIETWQKKGAVWKLVESRSLRPEDVRDANGAAPTGGGKLVKFIQQGGTPKKAGR